MLVKAKGRGFLAQVQKKALEVLDDLSAANFGQLVSTLYTHDQHTAAYICHKCQKKVKD